MNVVLEGRLLWLDGQWRFEGVWATDVKKKPSEKLPFTSAALLLPGLIHPGAVSSRLLGGSDPPPGSGFDIVSPAATSAAVLLCGHPLPRVTTWQGSFTVLSDLQIGMNESVEEEFVLALGADASAGSVEVATPPRPPHSHTLSGHGENSYGTFSLRGTVMGDGTVLLRKHYWSQHRRSRASKKHKAPEVLDRRVSSRKRTVSKVLAEIDTWSRVGAVYGVGDFYTIDSECEFLTGAEADDVAAVLELETAPREEGAKAAKRPSGGLPPRPKKSKKPSHHASLPSAPRSSAPAPPSDGGPPVSLDPWTLPVHTVQVGVSGWVSASALTSVGSSSGDVYEGETWDGLPHGHGTCMFASGFMVEGSWFKGVPHGWAVLTDDRDVTLFEGEFTDGEFNGLGTYYFDNGDVYHGRWRQGVPDGKGEYTCKSGQSYSGRWKAGKPHGKGSMHFSSDATYEGEWCEGVRQGRGLLTISNGFRYDGMWLAGLFDGRGECMYPDGSTFEGTWKGGRKEGRGTFTFGNGATYSGRFQHDRVIGTGTCTIPHPIQINASEWMIPFNLQTDVPKIHLRAGFDKKGK